MRQPGMLFGFAGMRIVTPVFAGRKRAGRRHGLVAVVDSAGILSSAKGTRLWPNWAMYLAQVLHVGVVDQAAAEGKFDVNSTRGGLS